MSSPRCPVPGRLVPGNCRIEPYLIKAAPHGGAAGPASAPGLCLGRPARAHAGPHSQGTQIRPGYTARLSSARRAVILGFDCPAHGHRVKIASSVAARSASLNPDAAPAHKGTWGLRE